MGDIQDAMSPLPIISPALLRVCKLTYLEARVLIRRNTWNFHRWTNDALYHIPQHVKDSMKSVYLRASALSMEIVRWTYKSKDIVKELRFLRHFTLGLTDEDQGLKGVTKLSWPDNVDWEGRKVPLQIAHFDVGPLFRKGKLTTFRLECPSTYPSSLYPFVWIWAWVELSFRFLLPREAHRTLDQLYAAVVEVLRLSDEHSLRNYQLLLVDGPVYLKTGEELRGVISLIQRIWEDNGVRVWARDPVGFERGTVITFQRVVMVEMGEREEWGDSELVAEVRRGQKPPNFPVVVDFSKLPSFITVVH